MRSSAGGHRGTDDWEVLRRGAGEGKFDFTNNLFE